MMRSHREYLNRKNDIGAWDYTTNSKNLDRFFYDGMKRNKDYDNIVTIGMRGDGDIAMGKGDDAENMKTLSRVIDGQRRIIKDIYGTEDAVPQLWAIFTEVQRYYDAGFTVPDDVTLLFCDNNWGYIRRIGTDNERKRKGGLGMYYHIDMNGGPWNDRWVNTTTIPKLREQLNLAYRTGIDRIWIINVGDLKPKEVPIDFIMNYAWNPDAVKPGDEKTYLENFARSIFGEANAADIADIIAKYSKYNLIRKPEIQVPGIFNHDEMLHMDSLWTDLVEKNRAHKEPDKPRSKRCLLPTCLLSRRSKCYSSQNIQLCNYGRLIGNRFTDGKGRGTVRLLQHSDVQWQMERNDAGQPHRLHKMVNPR